MRDLLLFQLLGAPALEVDAIAPLLEALAACSPKERFAHVGRLPRALTHPDPRLRAPALRALAGMRGLAAFRYLVTGLDDPEPDVRAAALEALRTSCQVAPARWAHALFHGSPAVRRAAIDGPAPDGAAEAMFYLLDDPATGDELRRRLDDPLVDEDPDRPCPVARPGSLGALFEFLARGRLARPAARRLLLAMDWREAAKQLDDGPQRTEAEVALVLAATAQQEAPRATSLPGHDLFDPLFDLFWDDEVGEAGQAFFARFAGTMGAWSPRLRARVVASLVIVTAQSGALVPSAARLLALHHPRFLGFSWLDPALRRASVEAIYAAGRALDRLDEDEVRALLDLDLCHRPGELLDLRVVGAILHFLPNHPYHRLLHWFGVDRIVQSFLADVEGSAPFLALPDNAKRGRAFLRERILREAPVDRGRFLALLALGTAAGDEELLDTLSPDEAARTAAELLDLVTRPGHEPSAKKVAAVAIALAPRLAATVALAAGFLRALLSHDAPERIPLGLALLGGVGSALSAEDFVRATAALDLALLRRLLVCAGLSATLPYGKEVALAHALRAHSDAEVRAWAEERAPAAGEAPPVVEPTHAHVIVTLGRKAMDAIADAAPSDLERAVRPCLSGATRGLCEALARRATARQDVGVGVALLMSFDRMEDVDAQLLRFGTDDPSFLGALDAQLVRTAERREHLPLLGHAFLHCWEAHAFAAMDLLTRPPGLAANLGRAAALRCSVLRLQVWEAAERVLAIWRWRDKARLPHLVDDALCELLLHHLDTDLGDAAARAIMALVESQTVPALALRLRPPIEAKLADLATSTRAILASWIESRGLIGRSSLPIARANAEPSLVERARRSHDLDELITFSRSGHGALVQEAVLRILDFGEPGLERLIEVLLERPPSFRTVLESVPLWPPGPGRERLRTLTADAAIAADLRYHLAVTLLAEGDREQLGRALAAAVEPTIEPWFERSDRDHLRALGESERALSLALATSPHPHAYQPALEHLLRARDPDDHVLDALRDFLLVDSERSERLRRVAARKLSAHGDDLGFPLILEEKLESGSGHLGPPALDHAPPERVAYATNVILIAGAPLAPPRLAFELFGSTNIDGDARAAALEQLIADGGEHLRRAALGAATRSAHRSAKLHSIALAFAWGVRVGRVLTGRIFRIQAITGKGLGYTRLNEDRIFVSPLPILLGAQDARAIVEGLILHELGHHLHHRGDAELAVWKKSEDQGIHGLLNLVADEHLERNLRGVDAAYGDRLKRLSSHAFQHTDREVPITDLLDALGARAAAVLTATRLGLARDERSVQVESGSILFEMERAGLSFSRFFRALRMGLGNRHHDPKVAAGLACFKAAFRKRTMPDLLAVAHELRAIFGWETRLVEHLGPHETMEDAEAIEAHGEGITQEEIDAEVQRVLDPRQGGERDEGGRASKGPGWINVNPDEAFRPLTQIVKVIGNPVEHRRLAEQVRAASIKMRRYFEALGLTYEPQRFRMQGRRFDRTRTLAVVLRGDPRMLIARQLRIATDLFLGVIIDCSGSMQTRANIDKARLFGTMLAEATRGLRGVDLRIFGFTDQVIYDAGDAARPAAHALEAGGGNNDAGALWHAARVAQQSRRKARLLVMISDGLPTECSTAALRAVVNRLGNKLGICCAQVAVQPLAEVCFPHYVVLQGDEVGASVHRFGKVVADLVQKAMRIG